MENAVDLLFGFVYRIFLFCGEVAQRRARQNGKIGIGLLTLSRQKVETKPMAMSAFGTKQRCSMP